MMHADRTWVLGACLALAAGPAAAVLECQYYDEFVAAAVMVIQITDTTVTGPDAGSNCTLTGTVARVFTGDMAIGTRVQTPVPCDNIQGTVGGTIWTESTRLAAAPVVEVHIGAEGGPAGDGAGVVLLEALSDAPSYQSFCNRG